jgi:hypothetical protein
MDYLSESSPRWLFFMTGINLTLFYDIPRDVNKILVSPHDSVKKNPPSA